jgi:MFS superfamily sulfate permease-like transporter
MINTLLLLTLLLFVQSLMIVVPAAILAGVMLVICRRIFDQFMARWPWLVIVTWLEEL